MSPSAETTGPSWRRRKWDTTRPWLPFLIALMVISALTKWWIKDPRLTLDFLPMAARPRGGPCGEHPLRPGRQCSVPLAGFTVAVVVAVRPG
jgi:hypothetical protein